MSRYDGYTDPLEVLVALVKEQKRTNELLEALLAKGEETVSVEKTVTQRRVNARDKQQKSS